MSADPKSKQWLLSNERALQGLVRHPGRPLISTSRIWNVSVADLQAWLDHYNGGSPMLTEARITQVKIDLGILTAGRAPARPADAPTATPLPEPASSLPDQAPAITEQKDTSVAMPEEKRAAIKPETHIPKMKTEPWLKAARGPQQRSVDKHRKLLEQIAAGKLVSGDPALAQFLKKWTGSPAPEAETVKAFLEWLPAIAQGGSSEAATDSAPNKPRKAKRGRGGRRAAVPAQTKTGRTPPLNGWEELEAVSGRYSGVAEACDRPAITLGAQFCRQHAAHVAGLRARIFWNAKGRQLRVLINGTGLPLKKEAGTIICASSSLPALLGTDPIEFTLVSVESGKAGSELLLEEVASE